MKTINLLLSNLNITEDDYSYKGYFTLTTNEKTKVVELSDLDSNNELCELKAYFDLEEDTSDIRNVLMDIIIEKANISSVIVEGEDFEENMKRKNTEITA